MPEAGSGDDIHRSSVASEAQHDAGRARLALPSLYPLNPYHAHL
jgi:hypothetical protein